MTDDQIKKLIDDRIELQQTHSQKEAAYYSALVNVWVNTRFEFDRSLLTLSAGGIALVVTLMTTVGVPTQKILVAQMAAALAFAASLALLFLVYRGNAEYVERVLKNSPTSGSLKKLDMGALFFFIIGVLILFYVGIVSADSRWQKEMEMSKTQELIPAKPPKLPGRQKDSVEGIEELRPKQPLAPTPPAPAPATQGGQSDKKV